MHDSDIELLEVMRFGIYKKRKGSSTETLLRLYPYKESVRWDAELYDTDPRTLYRLRRQKCIELIHGRRKRYRLTRRGRFHVLCHVFDVGFLCMCILVEAYTLSLYQNRAGLESIYPVYDMTDLFGHMYSTKTICNATGVLYGKELAVRVSNGTLQLLPDVTRRMSEHSAVIAELHTWICAIPSTMNKMAIEDPVRLQRIRRRLL